MYHKSNLGRFGEIVAEFSDLNGYVPEPGDHWSQGEWDALTEWDDENWQEHVEGAVRATVRAERELSEWQQSS